MAHDVFISYAAEDLRIAEAVCRALEENGVRCWYAPRDVPFGTDYEEAIVDAIYDCRLVLLILSTHSNASAHVRREIQNACAEEVARPVLPVRVDNVALSKALRYYLSSAHWLDASTPPVESHLPRLVAQLRARLTQAAGGGAAPNDPDAETAWQAQTPQAPSDPSFPPARAGLLSRGGPGTPDERRAARDRRAEAERRAEARRHEARGRRADEGLGVPAREGAGLASALARPLRALRPSQMSPALKRALLVVAVSLPLLVGGVAVVCNRLDNPVPLYYAEYIAFIILCFLLGEGVLTYVHARWFRRGKWLLGVVFVAAMAGIIAYWNNYYVWVGIRGHVTNQAGEPITGAKVFLLGDGQRTLQMYTTGSNGWYYFHHLEPASYTLYVEAFPTYAYSKFDLRVSSKETSAEVVLKNAGPSSLTVDEPGRTPAPRRR